VWGAGVVDMRVAAAHAPVMAVYVYLVFLLEGWVALGEYLWLVRLLMM
jgi:hypothetical protein